MEKMLEVLEKTYNNPFLRKRTVPLFIGKSGLGKTRIIEQFAKNKGVNLVSFITSQRNPFEISGMAIPRHEVQRMTVYDFDMLLTLKDGDILFFDEVFNGNPVVLNACLTLLENREMISGKMLPNIMIVAAANEEGMVPLTPQIKERFVWHQVKFSPRMWKDYMKKEYFMPEEVSDKICKLIIDEKFSTHNFFTPRSMEKALHMEIEKMPNPYSTVLQPILNTIFFNNLSGPVRFFNNLSGPVNLVDDKVIEVKEGLPWIDLIRYKYPDILLSKNLTL